jgi:hypothetical protein
MFAPASGLGELGRAHRRSFLFLSLQALPVLSRVLERATISW